MKLTTKLLYLLGSIALGGLIVYAARGFQTRNMARVVAEEGYETANDILFPHNTRQDSKLHYGPVLPDGFSS
ncbi:MAG: hypothetical protein ABIN57_05775 [Chitinophagaceae bacterium]